MLDLNKTAVQGEAFIQVVIAVYLNIHTAPTTCNSSVGDISGSMTTMC